MKSRNLTAEPSETVETDELFEMANLYPGETGLPMTVWVSPRGNARHDARIKVHMTHGSRMTVENTAVVAIRPSPHIIAGRLASEDETAVFHWITLNSTALIAYWNGDIGTIQLAQSLVPLAS
jgi:hypothetical protein